MLIHDAFGHHLHQFVMRNGIEVLGNVGINDFGSAYKEVIPYVIHRLMGIPLRSESVRVVLKVGFEDRLNYYLHGHLYDPVFDHRYPQRPLTPACLRNVNPTDSLRLVGFTLEFSGNLFKILLSSSPLLYPLKGLTVYSRCSLVRSDKSVGMVQDIHPVNLVIEKIESVLLFLLGLPV